MTEPGPTGWEGADRWFASDDTGGGSSEGHTPPCAVCGAELEPDQTYCLECGSPTPHAPLLRRSGRTVGILAGAMLVLGLGAGALAYAVVTDDDPGSPAGISGATSPGQDTSGATPFPTATATATAPLTGGLPPDPSIGTSTTPVLTTPDTTGLATGFETVTGPASVPTTTEDATTETPSEPPIDPPVASDSDWPEGRTAWTAILASVRNEAAARSAKSRAASGGRPAGVLFSSDYPDLRAGYWVVFSGTYAARTAAVAQATKLRPSFPGAYARQIAG